MARCRQRIWCQRRWQMLWQRGKRVAISSPKTKLTSAMVLDKLGHEGVTVNSRGHAVWKRIAQESEPGYLTEAEFKT